MNVVSLRKEPCRAIIVKRAKAGRFTYEIAPMERARGGKAAVYIGYSFGTDDADEALQCAIGLRSKSGLPVVDLTRHQPPQVAA